ncbi:MAG TPA: hypothetical protein VFG87_09025 [Amycolatopsis sp.]|nr:hypothetical protein [Amycolatopsis sp.]
MPEPILTTIATALATKAATGLYDLVKQKFSKDPEATRALEAAEAAPQEAEPIRVLAERLAAAQAQDPGFAEALRTGWAQHAEGGGVINQISGTVHGKVVQARDIHGNISF